MTRRRSRRRCPATQEALARSPTEARALKAPTALASRPSTLVAELDRADPGARHGRARRSTRCLRTGGGRELEAQTSIKRGYLNLLHAREAIGRVAREVAAMRPSDLIARPATGSRTAPAPTVPTYLVDADIDGEGP